jgi:hypothetical protein
MLRDEKVKRIILNRLKYSNGEDRRISREDLLDAINAERYKHLPLDLITDRFMRKMIEELRKEKRGCMIVASQEGGYFWAADIKELDKHTQHDINRAVTLLDKINTQRKNAGLAESKQTRMF